eukprot:TRINITY_DN1589_c0_g2_i1.p2 TRINITY_DN1589_c0_g2~~TRINITY_DN1589_c0_g2_i1.p2  ORF type:complete len:355 (-),score=57.56 TRINITY_DN1589_c0_g2_i1:196-1260(-)
MSMYRALIGKIKEDAKDVLSDPSIPSTIPECETAISQKKAYLKSKLESDMKQAIADAEYKEVSREKVGEREVGRRVVSTWVSGNTQHTEYEITIEEEYKIHKEKMIKELEEKFAVQVEEIDRELKEFARKCEKKLKALTLMAELEQAERKENEGFWNTETFEYFANIVGILISLWPPARAYTILRNVITGAKWAFKLGKFMKTEAPPGPPKMPSLPGPPKMPSLPGPGYRVTEAIKPHPEGKDRTIPNNIHEEIAHGALRTLEDGDIKIIAPKGKVRDIKRLASTYGGRDWEKAEFKLQRYDPKKPDGKGETFANIHFYIDKNTCHIVEPKYKPVNREILADPLKALAERFGHE